MRAFDIIVVGGGIVGLTQALALKNSGLSVAVVESHVSQGMPSDDPELRVSALTLATENIFHNLGVWQHLDPNRLCSYVDMQVWDQDSFGKITFSADQVKKHQLGHIVENQAIRHSLWIQAQNSSHIELLAPSKIKQLVFGQQECFITLDDTSQLTARLVIGADGANSVVKKQANLAQTFWDYDQHAIVATVKTAMPHKNTARQIFTPTGPLAFLPLWDAHHCSIVWSQDEPKAATLLKLSNAEFDKALTVAFDGTLGLCELVSDRQSYPLKMRYTRQWVGNRVAIIGDAAHTIHPLAGQGANLGILDAAALAEQIIKLVEQNKDFGLAKNLRPFERWRKTEAVKMVAAMEGFKRLFAGDQAVKKLIRDTGLSLANHSSFTKQKIIQHAMGLEGELPELAKLRSD
ncbi:FAD-dependent oxidoreductase [Paraglaciecola arctica]|uniref:Protein visC n=1 Tax=Paraglaciecola arctica BSs20135 TaxID=493475 RepID=K6XLD7_9ALTE|nr:FAD-dependent oxidoreductase [Paraglaciecola arctica]GAC21464.1 protein visC [Paraglaciecola arctica BSs20135]